MAEAAESGGDHEVFTGAAAVIEGAAAGGRRAGPRGVSDGGGDRRVDGASGPHRGQAPGEREFAGKRGRVAGTVYVPAGQQGAHVEAVVVCSISRLPRPPRIALK